MSSQAGAEAALERLLGLGITHFVLCPGSRSAPFAYALRELEVRGDITLHVETDERVAAFVALGLGHASGIPAPVITTSGSAVANLHPATVEAYHGGIPFVALTADRPEYLRNSGANQTTNQVGMLGPNLVNQLSVSAEDIVADPELVDRALAQVWRGPVHINVAFDNPLHPDAPSFASAENSTESSTATTELATVNTIRGIRVGTFPGPPVSELRTTERGFIGEGREVLDDRATVIIAGPGTPYSEVLGRSARGQVPVFAEPAATERHEANAVPAARIVAEAVSDEIERVIITGHPTLSRPITSLMSRTDIDIISVRTEPVPTDPGRVARMVEAMSEVPAQAEWTRRLVRAGQSAHEAGRDYLGDELDALQVAAQVANSGGNWFVGASNVIRDIDLLAGKQTATFFANRGLAGIDGTMSSARGMAHLLGPMKVVVGDLTFIHDIGGLVLTAGQDEPDLDIVVIDDSGGGIFATLEHGDPRFSNTFDRVFRTAKNLDILMLAKACGWEPVEITSTADLRDVLALPPARRIIRVGCAQDITTVRARRRELTEVMRQAAKRSL
ncbi:2-succinyl-5-enolpyruvyl-6-hydroxy-3-cyclohexene-1-carboxylic-acid synthase [Flaviflexus massiliensis]|uniref:2-succinyl-5-enolpyruvyl-6-hydroxy-3- cyclohexene-1-carboxylic-acid synthase n=1 Tax=Flaviflexus massiliensis TaxID=1522309 RepID=UPI0006D5A11B|nr:2-succinyl-5-enolpyruvyl-6-hydroxy-3-cyclohexene-1-carboxylic-acid synthase [Flaviflexus massiliensis]